MLGVCILSALMAFFISSRAWPWFVRATILIIWAVVFLLVDAGDLTLVLLVSQFSIFLAVQFENTRQSQLIQTGDVSAGRLLFLPRFKIVDLLLTLVIVSAISAMLTQAAHFSFPELIHLVSVGFAIGIWCLAGISLLYWKFPWRKKMGLGFVAMSAALTWVALNDLWFGFGLSFWFWFFFLLIIASVELLMLSLYRRSVFQTASVHAGTSKTGVGKLISGVATAVLLVIVFCFAGATTRCFVYLSMPPELSQPRHRIVDGEPNGFTELSEAGVEFGNSLYLSTNVPMNPGQLVRNEVTAYSNTFDKLDLALSRATLTSIDLSALDPDKDSIMDMAILDQVQSIRGVARALSVKASQEIHDGNYDEAMNDGLRCFKACESLNDSILVTHLVGIACEGIASHSLSLAIENATTTKLKEAAQTLEKIDAESMPLDQVLANDDSYVWRLSDWKMRLFYGTQQIKLGSPENEQFVAARARRDTIRNQLRSAIALELYKRDHGCFPDELAELVPVYLNDVPDDPFSLDTPRQPLRFEIVNDKAYKLYSVSRNGVDDDGEINNNDFTKGDLNYAEFVRRNEMEYRQEAEDYAKQNDDEQSDEQE